MEYQSSRGGYGSITAAEAIKMGLSPDGGLFVPEYIPAISGDVLKQMEGQSYPERACTVLSYFLQNFSQEEIKDCVYGAYNEQSFDDRKIAPLVEIRNDLYIQELWHGPTCAFKDMALQILPRLMRVSADKTGEKSKIVILVATSGDTGKAALEGFKDVKGTRIIVFYPHNGVSEVQKKQMLTQEGKNVYVAAVEGNFDDAQSGVKQIFNDNSYIEILDSNNKKMSSANSINWGRLLPQIVYYISAYVDLKSAEKVKDGQSINVVVPTGNFGNILAAFYARKMGIPINKLICASNANNVLTEFINTGVYDRNREFYRTISPSMDILISSNLERLLYELSDHDAKKIAGWMDELKNKGSYEVDQETKAKLQSLFWAGFADDTDTLETIKKSWQDDKYLLDTHTAVARRVYESYTESTADNRPAIIASTASPFKFGSSVAEALLTEEERKGKSEFELLDILSEYTKRKIPAGIKDLDKRPVLHNTVTGREEMGKTVLRFLGIKD